MFVGTSVSGGRPDGLSLDFHDHATVDLVSRMRSKMLLMSSSRSFE
jgi:hypothetical protein